MCIFDPDFHDLVIFYANDHRCHAWYHKDDPAKPYAKGEGASLMVAHVISPDYGWLESHDGSLSARHIIRPGKNHDGYFTNTDILDQFQDMVTIVKTLYPHDEHVFIYDNATIHLK
ncbi:hypothetical protein AN958_11770 [Leucoagaricus sp. SymC.cos]|nr:hypothetical protein AN958_11770 [Leucoagaricus sp. SymC.cos]